MYLPRAAQQALRVPQFGHLGLSGSRKIDSRLLRAVTKLAFKTLTIGYSGTLVLLIFRQSDNFDDLISQCRATIGRGAPDDVPIDPENRPNRVDAPTASSVPPSRRVGATSSSPPYPLRTKVR